MQRPTRAISAFVLCLVASLGVGWWFWIREPALPRTSSGYRYDPIEDDPEVRPYLEAAGKEAVEKNSGGKAPGYFSHKKRILKEKYGIDWRSPAELNPDWAFD